jgi:hypothetical protein
MVIPLVALAMAQALSSDGFYPIGEAHGVQVYRRNADHGIELGAEGNFAAPPAQVLAVLLDYDSHPKWVKGLAESRVLDRSDGALDVYQRLNLPVISDRDFTLHVTWGGDGDGRWLRFGAVNRGPAPRNGVVRVTTHTGEWHLEPIDGGRGTHAIYRFHLDLAGSFPSWMGKNRAGKDVEGLFEHIRDQLRYYNK